MKFQLIAMTLIPLASALGLNFSQCTIQCMTLIAESPAAAGMIPSSVLTAVREDPLKILSDQTTIRLVCTTSLGKEVATCLNEKSCPEASLISNGLKSLCTNTNIGIIPSGTSTTGIPTTPTQSPVIDTKSGTPATSTDMKTSTPTSTPINTNDSNVRNSASSSIKTRGMNMAGLAVFTASLAFLLS